MSDEKPINQALPVDLRGTGMPHTPRVMDVTNLPEGRTTATPPTPRVINDLKPPAKPSDKK